MKTHYFEIVDSMYSLKTDRGAQQTIMLLDIMIMYSMITLCLILSIFLGTPPTSGPYGHFRIVQITGENLRKSQLP
ncbi:hypothetical protein [Peribacillus sp. NJ4]|uniref:hypothetical protein n=1 Tax=Peribacillus sp. NJ4 TaxID=3055862 RepID=UPI0025A22E66|nr:hypothetical protein [Peribacillus sp. NJ4]